MALSKEANAAKQQVWDIIERVSAPEKMSPAKAIEFLEEIGADIDAQVDALRDENDL